MNPPKFDARRLPPKAQEDLRRRVVHAVAVEGMSQVEATRVFGVSRGSIHNWLRAYESGGPAALQARKRGPKRSSRLKGHQAATIVRLIEDRHPEQLHLPFALWTREAVGDLIRERFGIDLSVWTVGRHLKRWGFTPQKPLRRAYERDPVAVKRWMEQEYPAIATRAKAEKGRVYWGDEMGMRSDHQVGRSYGRKGKTPAIAGTGQRFGCNMVSALTNRGQLSWMVFRERFTAPVFIEFLRRLVKHAGRKVFLIVDGHPVHRSRKVQAWVRKRPDQIELFRLPGYSPDLNPDELLNQDVKSNAVGRRRPATQDEMISTVRSYLRSTQRQPQIVRSYFNHPDVRYAAA
jgi:transposase